MHRYATLRLSFTALIFLLLWPGLAYSARLPGVNTGDYSIPDGDPYGAYSLIELSGAPQGSTITSVQYQARLAIDCAQDYALELMHQDSSGNLLRHEIFDGYTIAGVCDDGGTDDDASNDQDIVFNWRVEGEVFNGRDPNGYWALYGWDLLQQSSLNGKITAFRVTVIYDPPPSAPPPATNTPTLDVDGDGDADANDGVLIQRRLNGAATVTTNITLPSNVGGSSANGSRSNAELISTIDNMSLFADVDGDADVDANDGLMIQRRLTGAGNVISNIQLPAATGGLGTLGTRTNEEVLARIDNLIGGNGDQSTSEEPTFAPLDFQVIDAQYNQASSSLILLGDDLALHQFDPISQTIQSVPLPAAGTSLAVSPDGTRAIIGHDGSVSDIDLKKNLLNQTLPVPINVSGVLLPGNGHAYLMPPDQSSQPLHIANLSSGDVTPTTKKLKNIYAALHPDRKQIHTQNGKYDIDTDGSAIYEDFGDLLYAKEGCNVFRERWNLWISDEGERVYTSCGNSYRLVDRTYTGQFQGYDLNTYISGLSERGSQVAVLTYYKNLFREEVELDNGEGSYIDFYESYNLGYTHRLVLPYMEFEGRRYLSRGRFIFHDNAGRLLVVSETEEQAGQSSRFGIHRLPAQPVTLASSITANIQPGEYFLPLNFNVVDAQYSPLSDQLILLSDTELYKYDQGSASVDTITLPAKANTLAISPDGGYALVGHDGLISYIDLTSNTLLALVGISANAFDVELPGNGYAYVIPREYQWDYLRTVNLETSEETLMMGIRAKTQIALHPSGNYIYGADSDLSPSDIEKYDISNGPATYVSDSPYHGDYAMCGNIWISDDGNQIYTACGNVFRSSTDSDDMTYLGNFAYVKDYNERIRHLSEHQGRVAVLQHARRYNSVNEDTYVTVYDASSFSYRYKVDLPTIQSANGTFDSHGRFVFHSETKNEMLVVLEAGEDSGVANGFGIWVRSAP